MKSIDKAPFWIWPAGMCAFGVVASLHDLVEGRWLPIVHMVIAMGYAVGLGRALLRRRLQADLRAENPG
ncbi:hypothetical protein CS0771_45840 [Catellatospora sp. IY07-71]|uniref:hypothetical protein n=1 Tax=Catellatospora sp. IY07-71 TaxID=2728827 RepID=UPI001BB3C854|nr:hypothetical protein [Catellatospora sp. IY07-71]BCJ75040.1 hypothetical protein CS0771_45840 [Catellatospora sp. IY07-71]